MQLTLSSLVLQVAGVARQAENACFSPVTGNNLLPGVYTAARNLQTTCKSIVRELHDEKQGVVKNTEPTAPARPMHFPADPDKAQDVRICICQRMYDGLPTGMNHIDRWIERLGWPKDWLKQVYHNPFGPLEDVDDVEFAREVKYRVEANCKAHVHYSNETSDLLDGGRAVFTSSDAEKNAELRDAMELDLWYASNPHELRKTREYRGDDADLVDGETGSDALAKQRRPDEDKEDKVEQPQMTLDFDPSTMSRAQRKAVREAQFGDDKPLDAFRVQYAVNLSRIRAKNEQARRDVWNLIREMDEDSKALYIAYVKDAKAKGKSFVTIRTNIRRSVKATLALGVVA